MHRMNGKAIEIEEGEVTSGVEPRIVYAGVVAIVGYAMLCGLLLLNTTGG